MKQEIIIKLKTKRRPLSRLCSSRLVCVQVPFQDHSMGVETKSITFSLQWTTLRLAPPPPPPPPPPVHLQTEEIRVNASFALGARDRRNFRRKIKENTRQSEKDPSDVDAHSERERQQRRLNLRNLPSNGCSRIKTRTKRRPSTPQPSRNIQRRAMAGPCPSNEKTNKQNQTKGPSVIRH